MIFKNNNNKNVSIPEYEKMSQVFPLMNLKQIPVVVAP